MKTKALQRGIGLLQTGAFAEAAAIFEAEVLKQPKNLDVQFLLGSSYASMGRIDEAIRHLEKAEEIDPASPRVAYNLGTVYLRLKRYQSAEAYFQLALQSDPSFLLAHQNLASLYLSTGRYERANEHFKKMSSHASSRVVGLAGQATSLERLGRYREAYDMIWPLFLKGDRSLEVLNLLARICSHEEINSKAETMVLKALEASPPANWVHLSASTKASYFFSQGHLYEKKGEYVSAFSAFAEAKSSLPQTFDEEAHQTFCDGYRQRLNKISKARPRKNSSVPNLVFVVGMPRSGSTLVEQILVSHPSQPDSVGESSHFAQTLAEVIGWENVNKWESAWVELSGEEKEAVRHGYLTRVMGSESKRAMVVDKTLNNAYFLPLIFSLFPTARALYCQRDPVAICLSCFKIDFAGMHAYTNNLEVLGRTCRRFNGLMEKMKKAYPHRIYPVDYEVLVRDFQPQVEALLTFCDLPFAQECLAFHRSQRVVRTASYHQVSKPLYDHSVSLHERYGTLLDPLRQALEGTD